MGEAINLPLADLTAADLARWRELAADAVEPNPFFEPEFVLPLAEAMPHAGVSLQVVRAGDEWIATMPVRRTTNWRRLPLAGTVGWKSSYTYLGTPLLRSGRAPEGARDLMGAAVGGRRYLGLELLGTAGPAGAAIDQAADELGFTLTPLRDYERAALYRRDDPSGYVALKPKHRRELRRLRDRLGEELGESPECHDESGSEEAVAEFLALEGSGWKREHGTALASDEAHAEMFTRICREFRELGRLHLLLMKAGPHTLAAKCNLVAGGGVFCFKIAFDENWARFSPGVQLEMANIDFFHDAPALKWMDSCAEPTNDMINRLWPDRRPIQVAAVTGRGAGRATERVFRAAVQTRQMIKRRQEKQST